MGLEPGVDRIERGELLHREVAPFGEDGVQGRRGVALREDESIAILQIGSGRVDPEFVEVEDDEDLGHGQ